MLGFRLSTGSVILRSILGVFKYIFTAGSMPSTKKSTFTRDSDQTFHDFEGILRIVNAQDPEEDVPAFQGLRYVKNLANITAPDYTLSSPIGNVDLVAGRSYTLSVEHSNPAVASGFVIINVDAVVANSTALALYGDKAGPSGTRYSTTFVPTATGNFLILTWYGNGNYKVMVEDVTGQANPVNAGYVEDYEYFDTTNENTVDTDSGIVTENSGMKITYEGSIYD